METRVKEGRGDGVGIRTIGSMTKGRTSEVFVWLAASTSESARDKERLNICTICGMSVLFSVTSLLVGAFNALVDVDMSLSSAMVGIVDTLVNLAVRCASETCGGARGSSKKVDGVNETARKDEWWGSHNEVHSENNQDTMVSFGGRSIP